MQKTRLLLMTTLVVASAEAYHLQRDLMLPSQIQQHHSKRIQAGDSNNSSHLPLGIQQCISSQHRTSSTGIVGPTIKVQSVPAHLYMAGPSHSNIPVSSKAINSQLLRVSRINLDRWALVVKDL